MRLPSEQSRHRGGDKNSIAQESVASELEKVLQLNVHTKKRKEEDQKLEVKLAQMQKQV